jgi:hypothetical protein
VGPARRVEFGDAENALRKFDKLPAVRMRRLFLVLVLFGIWSQTLVSQIKTRAERSDYIETSRYDDVIAFLNTVAKGSSIVHNYPILRTRM